MLGVSDESVRRWKRVWEKDSADALRRRPATGRAPKSDDAQAERVRAALEQGAQAHDFEADARSPRLTGSVGPGAPFPSLRIEDPGPTTAPGRVLGLDDPAGTGMDCPAVPGIHVGGLR